MVFPNGTHHQFYKGLPEHLNHFPVSYYVTVGINTHPQGWGAGSQEYLMSFILRGDLPPLLSLIQTSSLLMMEAPLMTLVC